MGQMDREKRKPSSQGPSHPDTEEAGKWNGQYGGEETGKRSGQYGGEVNKPLGSTEMNRNGIV